MRPSAVRSSSVGTILGFLCLLMAPFAAAQAEPARGPMLGLKVQPVDGAGVMIVEVVAGYPATSAGLKPGDRIVRVGDREVSDLQSFRDAVLTLSSGATVQIAVLRDGQNKVITITLAEPAADVPGARAPTLPELRAELLKMLERDQAPRARFGEDLPRDEMERVAAELEQTDAANRARLKQIIAEQGFPTISMVGTDGARAAFIIVQHADRDPRWQAEMLPVMEALARGGEASKSDVAYLTDRVLRAQGKPQRYGTQYYQQRDAGGVPRYVPPVVEDLPRLDERRLSMGLGPWAQYERMMAQIQKRDSFPAPHAADGR